MDTLRTVGTRATPQNEQADPRQVGNSAGGYTFAVSDEAQLRRFLTLGIEGGTYYAGARELALDNVGVLQRMAASDPKLLVDTIVDISTRGAAPKQNPALFALAYAAAHGDRSYALSKLSEVARTGTHLFVFAGYVEQFRGWGRGLRRAVGNWYLGKHPHDLAYQAVKYRQREGWSHRDLLRLAHPISTDPVTKATFDWIAHGSTSPETPGVIEGFLKAQEPGADLRNLILGYPLTWEMLPSEALNDPKVWEALFEVGSVPLGALIRQLPRLTRLGLLPRVGGWTGVVAKRITNPDRLNKARVHPMNVLVAQRTYASGKGKGSSWTPTPAIADALDAAFYLAYDAVEPAGKRTLVALDISSSMTFGIVGGLPLTPRDASAALALVAMATEPECSVVGFSTNLTPLDITARRRLDDVLAYVDGLPFGGTDCALPMLWALKHQVLVNTFVVLTDNETWAGRIHPHQALTRYRQATGIPAKLIVSAMTATRFSIADPSDPGMLDVAGFDTSVPQVITNFSRGL